MHVDRSEHDYGNDPDNSADVSGVVTSGGRGAGSLMPPGALGRKLSQTESTLQTSDDRHGNIKAHPATIHARKRTLRAIRRFQLAVRQLRHAHGRGPSFDADDDNVPQTRSDKGTNQTGSAGESSRPLSSTVGSSLSKVTAFTYRGMEVVFATSDAACYGMFARTRHVFQTLDLPSKNSRVISLLSHPTTGQVIVTMADGSIQSYSPEAVDPAEVSFGRYRWWNGPGTNCKDLFYELDHGDSGSDQSQPFSDVGADRLDSSLSQTYKLLVAHRSQLAVLDMTPFSYVAAGSSERRRRTAADILWTTRLPGRVVTAKISGDGESIAVVLEHDGSGDEDDETDGVHTFERDQEDGSSLDLSSNISSAKQPQSPSSLARSRSIGVLYKPGPFLVHPSPVTRLSFRGAGHDTSNVHSHDETQQGNDLLLTFCDETNDAKIFCQNQWRPLTEWTTPPKTRVDWVRGIAAFTLGDLESQKKPKSSSSAPPSRRPSFSSLNDINEALGKRHNYQSIPNHTVPSSNSGAWIAEVTFNGKCPAIRLSRLTYLKRGVDDLSPTLFENVSSFLPAGYLFETPILEKDDSVFAVEGVWPAWNPWLSETVAAETNETLRGSAMAFLGLSSGPGISGAGHFGDSLLGSTQSPPCEIRILATHPSSGKVVAMEFPVLGDQDWTSLELGSPRKSVMLISELDPVDTSVGDILQASMDYESSRLSARVTTGAKGISLTWKQQGTLSLLPVNWLPEDADPSKSASLLEESRWFKDDSLVPVPLALPTIRLPSELLVDSSILSLAWWPEDHFGSPPLLVALTSGNKIVVFELPPPWSSHEPVSLRNDDEDLLPMTGFSSETGAEDQIEQTYEVPITPDPEYGLGLRLEVQVDGSPATAGSFKRHPLNGDILPAEKTGMICLGDELVSAGGVSLDNKSFDDIISTVRDLGAECGPGNPMRLVFRRKVRLQRLQSRMSDSTSRRTFEEIIGIKSSATAEENGGAKSYDGTKTDENELPSPEIHDSSVVAIFSDVFERVQLSGGSTSSSLFFDLVPCHHSSLESPGKSFRSAALTIGFGAKVSSILVRLDLNSQKGKHEIIDLGRWDIFSANRCLAALDSSNIGDLGLCIVACDLSGNTRIGTVPLALPNSSSTRVKASARWFDAFQLKLPIEEKMIIRAFTLDLVGTMNMGKDKKSTEVVLWSTNPQPGHQINGAAALKTPDYDSYLVCADTDDYFVDFSFVNTGFLDVSPSLVVFSNRRATMFLKQEDNNWVACIHVAYSSIPSSIPKNAFADFNDGKLLTQKDSRSLNHYLIQSMLLAYSSKHELGELLSDWHSESILSHIFTCETGVSFSLNHRVRYLLHWLASEGMDISEDHVEGPLLVSPIPILPDTVDENTDAKLHSSPAANFGKLVESDEESSLRRLLSLLSNHLKGGTNSSACSGPGAPSSPDLEFPPAFKAIPNEDLLIVRSCLALVIDSPDFQSLDVGGQHFLLTASLVNQLYSFSQQEVGADAPVAKTGFFSPHVIVKKTSKLDESSCEVFPAIPSSSAMAALVSNAQTKLLDHCKRFGRTFDWSFAREMRLPFWVRSDTTLARVSEEIGQNIFREKRDVMESALFFIIAKKMRTLRNLAATDRSDNGRKFLKFLTSHDFSSERGKKAAEKNAFSLLRKCQYTVAAAFFLLAEPPSLNSAIETIITKLRDPDLAFMVARLVESSEVRPDHAQLGGVLGGGGGYAASGVVESQPTIDDFIPFTRWKPSLGIASKKLLINRVLPMSTDDSAFGAIQLLWLEKKEESYWCLSGLIDTSSGEKRSRSGPEIAKRVFRGKSLVAGKSRSAYRAAEKLSSVINFVSSPLLLKQMQSSARARFAASVIVANALTDKGIEIPAMQVVLHFADHLEPEENAIQSGEMVPTGAIKPTASGSSAQVQSSIFDSYEAPLQKIWPSSPRGTAATTESADIQSSIFGAYDVPQAAKPVNPNTGQIQSSIFESFDIAPQVSKPKPSEEGQMSSSIFDSFDVPTKTSRARNTKSSPSASGEMTSSIFDTFEVPSQASKSVPSSSGTTQSSIFDAYDVPRTKSRAEAERGTSETGVTSKQNGSIAVLSNEDSQGDVPVLDLHIARSSVPELWLELRTQLLEEAAARRLLREIASVLAQYHGDPPHPPIADFFKNEDQLVPSGASGILQISCDATHILGRVKQSLDELYELSGIAPESIVQAALRLLGPDHQQHRALFAVVLHAATGREDLGEDSIRAAAFNLMQFCQTLAVSFDNLVHRRRTRSHVSTQFLRRRAARVSWQLETCLWLHRGGGLHLSSVAFKEAVVAVRVGLLIASWNHNHDCLEAMIKNGPDCDMDEGEGRQLWTSLKTVASAKHSPQAEAKTSSGGWEFLVDCRRSEATQMLRDKKTGCFIIRPHSGDSGVFTLSFKTNLVPSGTTETTEDRTPDTSGDELSDGDAVGSNLPPRNRKKPVRKDDVVQHAIIRLAESGYRCGSFGPYTTLISLLEAVSDSLPFHLRFDLPPSNRIIKEEGSQPSPNAVFFRKLALNHADSLVSCPPDQNNGLGVSHTESHAMELRGRSPRQVYRRRLSIAQERESSFGLFLELLVLSAIRKQLSSVAAADYEVRHPTELLDDDDEEIEILDDDLSENGSSRHNESYSIDRIADAFRMLAPLSTWCRALEVLLCDALAPDLNHLADVIDSAPVDLAETATANIEAAPHTGVCSIDGGDALLRKMIQKDSGVDFSTLRLVDGGECTIVVIFNQNDTVKWMVSSGMEETEADAFARLHRIEKHRVIESIDVSGLKVKREAGAPEEGLRYRILDPWEVEAIQSWEGETLGASLGRERFFGFNLGKVGLASENIFRSLGGLPLLALWTCTKGGVVLTKALATVHPPWERASSGDLQFINGVMSEPPPFMNSIRQHLYRNALFRRLSMPQRFLALVQVELLDLKNLTAPGGSLAMSVYALLRLKREGSTPPLANKARTLDTAATQPVKLGKSSGPNAPASWGSVVRFRFPLPEQASVDGVSFDMDRELLFKGPPNVLQLSVYERKLLVDSSLGSADVRMDGLWAGGQLEEWVPLRSEKHAITWFARVRLTLRFELMCLASEEDGKDMSTAAPSVGLRRIKELSQAGGAAHEDLKRSMSSPDLITYFESMVY